MKLLISPTTLKEAQEAIVGGADIIDVKNPQEGALGANFPWIIRQIKCATPANLEVSCTIGEAPNQQGTITLAALGAATLGVDYVKVGLGGVVTAKKAVCLLRSVKRAVTECNPKIRVVAAGYADAQRIGSIDPFSIPQIAYEAQADVAMVDTAVKDGKTLIDQLSEDQLQAFVNAAHGLGLKVALAGSLRKHDLPLLCRLGADIAGLRGAACKNCDRVVGKIERKLVRELVSTIKQTENQQKRA